MKSIKINNSIRIIIGIIVAIFLLTLPNTVNATDIPKIISGHITETHTKDQIAKKYTDLGRKYNYSNSIFSTEPVFKQGPYVAGKLQSAVETDTLNALNYFRWLYGIKDVSIYTERQETSQKGAVALAKLYEGKTVLQAEHDLDKLGGKPADMDQEFYDTAKKGCNSAYEEDTRTLINANISKGEISPAHSVENFINDLYNISPNSWVGHRLDLLELEATKTSFGYCNTFTTLSMYYPVYAQDYKASESYYAYPSSGYFPMQNFTTSEYWSFMPTEKVEFGDVKISIRYNKKDYTVTPVGIEGAEENSGRKYPAIIFKLPNEIINDLGGERNQMPEAKMELVVSGIKNAQGRPLIYQYGVDFFDVTQYGKGSYMIGDTDGNGKITTKDAKMVLQHIVKKITLDEDQFKRGDTDGNGKMTTKDAKLILQYIVKKITKFPAEE